MAESYTDITSGMNNIQNLHVVIPHINGEAVNHSATKRQPQSPLQNVIKLIAVQVVKILTPSKLWRLSTLDKAIPTSRRVRVVKLKLLMKDIRRYIGYLNEGKIPPVEFFIESTYQDSKNKKRRTLWNYNLYQ